MMHQEIIYKNAIIDEGPPERYRLNLKVKNLDGPGEESRLIRCALNKKNPLKSNKTILLVGETGSGKSSLINAFLNYLMGIKKEHKKWYEIVDESNKNTSSKSQTSKVTVYDIFGFEDKTVPYSLTIIDTPGFGDTEGIEKDALITQKLLDLFRSDDGIKEISAVCLVLKASDNRLSDRLMYIFNSVVSLFGKDVEDKIVALMTHSDGMPPKTALQALQDANIKCAKNEKGQPVHFVFNNCLSTKITEDTEFGLEQAWSVTMRGMERFTAYLDKTTPQNLEKTVMVLNDRIELVACINNLTEKVDLLTKKLELIKQTQEVLEKNKEKLKTGKSFTFEVDEPYKVKEEIDGGMWFFYFGGAVTCNNCEENCHYPGCTLAWYPEHCEVMKKGRCTVCTNKCPAKDHVKETMKYVTKTRKVTKTIEELKELYEADKKESESILSKLQEEKDNLEEETKTLLDEAYERILSLEKMALCVNLVFSFVQFDVLIEEMKNRGDKQKVKKLEEIRGQMNKGIFSALLYAGAKCLEGFKNFRIKSSK